MPFIIKSLFIVFLIFFTGFSSVTLVNNGQINAAILTPTSPTAVVRYAASVLQNHIKMISGVTLPISTIGNEATYPGYSFMYVGRSTFSDGKGINVAVLQDEYYIVRTSTNVVYVVGKDAGTDNWSDMAGARVGTLYAVYDLLERLGVRWLWPGTFGTYAPKNSTVIVPDLNVTDGPAMVQRKFRQGWTTQSNAWNRTHRQGIRVAAYFGHAFGDWWGKYGTTHPEYFATLPAGYTQPYPATDRVKLCVSNPAVANQVIENWKANGSPNSLNICPNDSRGYCTCANCRAWDRPGGQNVTTLFNGAGGILTDRKLHFWNNVNTLAKAINPNIKLYSYAYSNYQSAPLEQTVPSNLIVAFVPNPPADTRKSYITNDSNNVVAWKAKGMNNFYLRPNWPYGGHVGPHLPLHRMGNSFKQLVALGIIGTDFDGLFNHFASTGPYYYVAARLHYKPDLTVDQIVDEYTSAFGSAKAEIKEYLTYWENFTNDLADTKTTPGNEQILDYGGAPRAYYKYYTLSVTQAAEAILNRALTKLGVNETEAKQRVEFLRIGVLHARYTSAAIYAYYAAMSNASAKPQALTCLCELRKFREAHASDYTMDGSDATAYEKDVLTGYDTLWQQALNVSCQIPAIRKVSHPEIFFGIRSAFVDAKKLNFRLNLKPGNYEFALYDVSGQKLYGETKRAEKADVYSKIYSIPSPGVYIATLKQANQRVMKRIAVVN